MKDWVLSHTQLTPAHSTQVHFTHLCPSPEHPRVCWKSLLCFLDSCHGTSHSTCPWYLGRRVFTCPCWWLSIPWQWVRLLRVRKHIKVHNVTAQAQLCSRGCRIHRIHNGSHDTGRLFPDRKRKKNTLILRWGWHTKNSDYIGKISHLAQISITSNSLKLSRNSSRHMSFDRPWCGLQVHTPLPPLGPTPPLS